MRGLLISFEGIDGSGKSTQYTIFKNRMEEQGIPYLAMREPGGTEAGEEIRDVLLQKSFSIAVQTELLLYLAARVELCQQVISPALTAGKVVLCDRFSDSTLAYQGYGGGLELRWIRELNIKATGHIAPDITFLFDLPIEDALKRRGKDPDRMEAKSSYFHQRVRSGYLDIASCEPQRVFVIDGLKEAQLQSKIIWDIVKKKYGRYFNREA